MKPISTSTHGILDYLTVGALFLLSRMFGWNRRVSSLLGGLALGTLGYSLVTRYEFSVAKMLPMKAHLILDALSGLALVFAPTFFRSRNPLVNATLIGTGVFEVAVAISTDSSEPPMLERSDVSTFQLPIDEREYLRQ